MFFCQLACCFLPCHLCKIIVIMLMNFIDHVIIAVAGYFMLGVSHIIAIPILVIGSVVTVSGSCIGLIGIAFLIKNGKK